jgi:hypothetical protein
MTLTSRTLGLIAVVAPLAVFGCSSDNTTTNNPPADGAVTPDGNTTPDGDVIPDGNTTPDGGGETIQVRVAHLSPDAPAVDVCIKAKGADDSTFIGPVLKAAIPAGLAFGQITGYVPLPPGEYTARLVAPNAANCGTPVAAGLPDYDLPALAAGTWATAAAIGQVGSSPATFTVKPFVDSRGTPPASGKFKIRFVHASPGTPAVDVGVGKGANFTRIWQNVSFPNAGAPTGADANGFLEADPLDNATITARLNSAPDADALSVEGVTAPAGAIVSTFAIGLATGSGNTRLSVLVCVDSADAVGGLTVCNRLPN